MKTQHRNKRSLATALLALIALGIPNGCFPTLETATCPDGLIPDAASDTCVAPSQAGAAGSTGAAGSPATSGFSGTGGSASGPGGTGGTNGGASGGSGTGGSFSLEQVSLATGGSHTCVSTPSVARCWGSNLRGQLGVGATAGLEQPNPVPAPVEGDELGDIRHLTVGSSHSCSLREDGRVFCWGVNDIGQLGSSANAGTTDANSAPRSTQGLFGIVSQIALGGRHSCAIFEDKRIFCWGSNNSGQLGTSTNFATENPNTTPTLLDNDVLGTIRQMALGGSHTCALREDGRVLCWGRNYDGQLGIDTTGASNSSNPAEINDVDLRVVRQVATGGDHTCALREDGRVLCWGRNTFGQLGVSKVTTPQSTFIPTLVDSSELTTVRQLALGAEHTCALREDGRVLCWGRNTSGQLGNGQNTGPSDATTVPTLVDNSTLGIVRQLVAGGAHTCALREDGRVLCWGSNFVGQLGTNTNVGTSTPNPAPALVEALPALAP
jgi:alpha-tubulin suppressor-like RCC1 family protein